MTLKLAVSLLLISGVALAPAGLAGQTTPRKGIDIYSTALIEAAREMEKQWGGLGYGPLDESTPPDYKHLLVCTDDSVQDEYPATADGRRFEYLTRAQLFSRRKMTEKDFWVPVVNPARVEGDRVKVVVEQRGVEIRDGKQWLAISDWGTVFFRFDCEKKEFLFDEVKLDGI